MESTWFQSSGMLARTYVILFVVHVNLDFTSLTHIYLIYIFHLFSCLQNYSKWSYKYIRHGKVFFFGKTDENLILKLKICIEILDSQLIYLCLMKQNEFIHQFMHQTNFVPKFVLGRKNFWFQGFWKISTMNS